MDFKEMIKNKEYEMLLCIFDKYIDFVSKSDQDACQEIRLKLIQHWSDGKIDHIRNFRTFYNRFINISFEDYKKNKNNIITKQKISDINKILNKEEYTKDDLIEISKYECIKNMTEFLDNLENEISIEDNIIDKIVVKDIISKLTKKEQYIIKMYVDGYSEKYIGEQLKVTQQNISLFLKKILVKIENLSTV